ncbi:1-phosphofructokinase [Sediminibacillus dalangtanensis]|uniref:Tagatose-6-phosphate kinase n=1 Tax=Sediminibacillus dalangtanensis TaxID=2729421 RepID=A0ABX7VU23_9BACI|nr:1-phosphofructokinase [Sediminibacillus dalangtanensis]QTM99120.1 1-phosphofructokinase [Sediminibacillus dalangtanensis]
MIYTLTPNPAIDLYVGLEALRPNHVNRTYEEDYQPNGKAINISIMLKKLGINSTALGFIAGFSGCFIKEELNKLQIATDFVEVKGITRINIFANAEQEYKIVNKGPAIPEERKEEMLEKVAMIPEHSMLFVSGSLPGGVDDTFYTEIASICWQNNIRLVLDISSKEILECLPFRPYLIKPNDEELASFFGISKENMDVSTIVNCSRKLLENGANQVLVSRGEAGAIYISPSQILKVTAPKGKVINTACSGDALLALFIGKLEQGSSLEEALQYASAGGSATAFSKGLCSLSDIDALIQEVKITQIKEEFING